MDTDKKQRTIEKLKKIAQQKNFYLALFDLNVFVDTFIFIMHNYVINLFCFF
jgi:hypothetical protein